MAPTQPVKPRGRPPAGEAAQTSAERAAVRRKRLKDVGGRSVTARLTAEAAEALDALRLAHQCTVDAAINQALMAAVTAAGADAKT